ncbi:MAG: DUF2254 domain-containing protein [Woeseia sp.]
MWDRFVFLTNRLRERLWVRPLAFCLLSVGAALLAKVADGMAIADSLPEVQPDSIQVLLSITASSMLVIATLAVASMVSAYASAASTATPRAFSLLIADDVSKNALSIFMGAFIFTIVALVALKNGFFHRGGNFTLFVMTIAVLTWVVLTFVRWVDWIARLGRIGTTIDKVERAAMLALQQRRLKPAMGGKPATSRQASGVRVEAESVGYVRHINMESLQSCAKSNDLQIWLAAVPGTLVSPGRALAYIEQGAAGQGEPDISAVRAAFDLGRKRIYDDDPRFGLIALSEIASRALSPAVNDPGTAIEIMGSFIRLFSALAEPLGENEKTEVKFDRVNVPLLSSRELLDDAFRPMVRDGAATVEVQIRAQKALKAIAALSHDNLAQAARRMSRVALQRAELALNFPHDVDAVNEAAAWSED